MGLAIKSMENRPYIVLARKYRPQTFDEVIGQDPVATTLKNAITLKRIGHAYLFTGPRGVGKTSMARIFAKALNCKNGPTIEPCGKCVSCQEIENARALDVLEVDGASNRGIEEIRTLRENVKFSPAAGNFKIYIIDEVHQITSDAFNALLKTLEEPPAHVKFIFATTAVNKVPATILSRCQRFDFRRIPTDIIAKSIKDIAKKEKIKIDDDAITAIAKAADGGLRDSQSLLDQISASSKEAVTKDDVLRSLGALEEDVLIDVFDALAAHDAKTVVTVLDRVLAEGKDPAAIAERFLEHTRNLLFVTMSKDLAELVDAPESYKKAILKQKESFTKDDLFYFFTVFTHTLQTIKRLESKRIALEVALVKLAQKNPIEPLADIIAKLGTAAPRQAPPPTQKKTIIPEKPVAAPKAQEISVDEDDDDDAPDVEELPSEDISLDAKPILLKDVWDAVLRSLKNEKISAASYLAGGEPVGVQQNVVKISFSQKFSFNREYLESMENKRLIEKHLSTLLEREIRVEFETVKDRPEDAEEAPQKASEPAPNPVADETIQNAMNIFGGRVTRL